MVTSVTQLILRLSLRAVNSSRCCQSAFTAAPVFRAALADDLFYPSHLNHQDLRVAIPEHLMKSPNISACRNGDASVPRRKSYRLYSNVLYWWFIEQNNGYPVAAGRKTVPRALILRVMLKSSILYPLRNKMALQSVDFLYVNIRQMCHLTAVSVDWHFIWTLIIVPAVNQQTGIMLKSGYWFWHFSDRSKRKEELVKQRNKIIGMVATLSLEHFYFALSMGTVTAFNFDLPDLLAPPDV